MSMWSVAHSGHTSVMVTTTDLWFWSLLQRPCRRNTHPHHTPPSLLTVHTSPYGELTLLSCRWWAHVILQNLHTVWATGGY